MSPSRRPPTTGPAAPAGVVPLVTATLGERDLAAAHAIEMRVARRPWSPTTFRAELDLADRRYVGAWVGDELVGYAGLMLVLDEAHVLTVVVAPRWRRRGAGAALLLELLGRARAGGARAVTLEVRAGNEPAQALYRRLGFVAEGVRPGYYEDDQEDAVIMWLRGLDRREVRAALEAQAERRGRPVPTGLAA